MLGSWRNKKVPSNNEADSSSQAKKTLSSRDLFLPRGEKETIVFTIFNYNFFPHQLDIQELKDDLPSTCKFIVPNPNELHTLELWITPPRESMWYGGRFKFVIDIPLEYKYAVILFQFFSLKI